MANTLTNMQAKIFADSAMLAFNSALLPLKAIATKFEATPAQKGSTITVPLFPVIAGGAYAGDYSPTDRTIPGKVVTLDQHTFISSGFTDRELMESPESYFKAMGAQQGKGVAKTVITYVMSLITAANFGNAAGDKFVKAANLITTEDIVDIRAKIKAKGIDPKDASIVLGDAFTSLLKDTVLSASMYGGAEAVRTGTIPGLFGFQGVYESLIIPANNENLIGFALAPQAIAFGSRYLQPVSMTGLEDAGMVTDDETGLTLGFRMIPEPVKGRMSIVTECLYGASAADGSALVRHLSA